MWLHYLVALGCANKRQQGRCLHTGNGPQPHLPSCMPPPPWCSRLGLSSWACKSHTRMSKVGYCPEWWCHPAWAPSRKPQPEYIEWWELGNSTCAQMWPACSATAEQTPWKSLSSSLLHYIALAFQPQQQPIEQLAGQLKGHQYSHGRTIFITDCAYPTIHSPSCTFRLSILIIHSVYD